MDHTSLYKVVLVFNLTKDSADEELARSKEEHSFPNLLSKQPGFVEFELVKISNEKTLSIQTWATEQHWWAALEAVKKHAASAPVDNPRENILVSRELLNGYVMAHRTAADLL